MKPAMPSPTPERSLGVAGWYGKLPSRGDFVGRGLPPDWLRIWDDWLAGALASAARQRPDCRERLRTMPPWQWLVRPSTPGDRRAWCGVVVASGDRVGRSFPLLVAEAWDIDALESFSTAAWQARGEVVARWIESDGRERTPEAFDAGLAALVKTPWPADQLDAPAIAPSGHATLAGVRARWPAAVSFWQPVGLAAPRAPEEGTAFDLPLPESWPPSEALLLHWLDGAQPPDDESPTD